MIRQEMIDLLGWHHRTMTEAQQDTLSRVEYIVEVAVLREREACAKVCYEFDEYYADVCVDAIRARGAA